MNVRCKVCDRQLYPVDGFEGLLRGCPHLVAMDGSAIGEPLLVVQTHYLDQLVLGHQLIPDPTASPHLDQVEEGVEFDFDRDELVATDLGWLYGTYYTIGDVLEIDE